MRYYHPRVQELVEAIQGPLDLLAGKKREILWRVEDRHYDWRLSMTILNLVEDQSWYQEITLSEITLSRRTLEETPPSRWPSYKAGLVRSFLYALFDQAKPVDASRVIYHDTFGVTE